MRRLLSLIWLLVPLSDAARAQEAFDLGSVVVTADRASAARQPAASFFVTPQEMQALDERTVAQALADVPGINVSPGSRGGSRNEARLYVRGFENYQIPVLVDGIPFYIPYDGEPTDLSRFTSYDLGGIEVSKGAASVLYGPNALGGVVNLVSRKPRREVEVDALAGIDIAGDGARKGERTAANLGVREAYWYGELGLSYQKTDFWRLPDDFAPASPPTLTPVAGNLQPAGRRIQSASEDYKASLKLALTPNDTDEYALAVADQRARKNAPPFAGPPQRLQVVSPFDWPRFDKRIVYLVTSTALGEEGAYLKTRAYYDSFQNTLLRTDDFTYDSRSGPLAFDSKYRDASWGGSAEIGVPLGDDNTLRGSAYFRRDKHREQPNSLGSKATVFYDFHDVNTAFALEDTQRLGEVDLVGGLSWNRRSPKSAPNDTAGGVYPLNSVYALDGQGGATWHLDEAQRVYTSLAAKSRFASMLDRYSYRLGTSIPNPYLKPERAVNAELGYAATLPGGLDLDAALFYSRLRNLIQGRPIGQLAGGGTLTQTQNFARAHYEGGEVGLRWRVDDETFVGADYTYVLRILDSQPKQPLYGVPHHEGQLYVTETVLEDVSVTPSLHFATGRPTSAVGEDVEGYAVFDLHLAWAINPQWQLALDARNLTDKLYALRLGFPQEGRNFAVTLRYAFAGDRPDF